MTMRPLEILLPLVISLYLLWPLLGRRRAPTVGILPAFAVVAMVTHGRVEGARWQMIPLYAFTILLFLWSLPAFLRARGENEIQPRPSERSLLELITALALLAVSTLPPALLPVPQIPPPSGPYVVGTATYTLVDESRKEIFSGRDEPRKLIFQAWYPAQPPSLDAKPALWMPEARLVAPAIAGYLKLPSFFLDHLALARSSAYENAAPNPQEGPYPVLVFSHGWNGFRQQSTFLMQELASHGYIVISLEHPYGARLTVFPDGQVAPNNPKALPPGSLPPDEYEAGARPLVAQWTSDIDYTLNTFANWRGPDPAGLFSSGLLDLERVGLMGHSTGAGAIIQFCAQNPRCKAGLALDPFMRPVAIQVLENGTRQPFLYLFSELWPFERNTLLFNRYLEHVPPENQVITILGADHYDFSDLPALSPLAAPIGLKGPIDGARVQAIIRMYAVAFFDQALKGKPTSLPAYPDTRRER
jgi:dienelactone hydrolase